MEHGYNQPHFPERTVVMGSRGVIGKEIVDHLDQHDTSVRAVPSSEIDLLDPGAVSQLSDLLLPGSAPST